ncbi:MAG: hypothetical protein M3R36_05345 [Bacteroidota bacterium]|nr:hypothetical protein [Bacteroidota bacterium]
MIFKVIDPNLNYIISSSEGGTEDSFSQQLFRHDLVSIGNIESIICNYNFDEILKLCNFLKNINTKINYLEL